VDDMWRAAQLSGHDSKMRARLLKMGAASTLRRLELIQDAKKIIGRRWQYPLSIGNLVLRLGLNHDVAASVNANRWTSLLTP
jgi:hypothetical protein